MTNRELLAIRSQLMGTLELLDRLIGPDGEQDLGSLDHVKSLERTKAIEWLLRERAKPMRPIEIWAELQELGRSDPKMEIQVTTYDLWQRGRIGKVERGVYVADPTIGPYSRSGHAIISG